MNASTESERWHHLQDLLDAALQVPPERRLAVLMESCGDDETLYAEATELLRHLDALPERVPIDALERWSGPPEPQLRSQDWIGREVGPFVLEECIGRGGSSLVFRASRRSDFTQQVAIKLLHGVGTPARRFLRERDFLAALRHPGIARIHDAGSTEEGIPYLVLEWVQGRRWDEDLREAQPSLRVRLERFARVCDAVAYAHQHLLVHRDIKPANLLIDPDGAPHLLDFGIATLLGAETQGEFTRELGPALTPAYAAPEQIRGEPATTATDVYALGVLLYETLTGSNPFLDPESNAARTLRAVTDTEAVRPSTQLERTLRAHPPRIDAADIRPAQLRGDLDTIVLTAMAKDPAQRYGSARQLADDVRAWLDRRPIWARPPSWRYLIGKFAQRHRSGVAAAALALTALLFALGVALWQSSVASRERAVAEQRLADVRKFVSNVLFDYHEGIQRLTGSLPMQQRMVEDSLRYLETLRRDAGDDVTLWSDLGEGYLKIGDLQGNPYAPNLGNFAGAAASYAQAEQAIAMLERIGGEDARSRWARGRIYARQAHLLHQDTDLQGAAEAYRKALAHFDLLSDEYDLEIVLEHADTLDWYGDLLGREGATSLLDLPGAQRAHAQSRRMREQALQRDPQHPRLRAAIYHSQLRESEDLLANNQVAQAEAALQRTLVTIQTLQRASPDDAFRQREVALVHSRLAAVQDALGKVDESIASALQSFNMVDAITRKDPDNDAMLQAVTGAAGWAARLLIRAHRHDEAQPIVERQIWANQRRLQQAPGNPEIRFALSLGYRRLGELQAGRGDPTAAIAAHREALTLQQPLAALAPEYALGVPLTLANIGQGELELRQIDNARTHLMEASDELRRLIGAHPEALSFRPELADMLEALGRAWNSGDANCARALAAWREALAVWDALAPAAELLPPQQTRRAAVQTRLEGVAKRPNCAG